MIAESKNDNCRMVDSRIVHNLTGGVPGAVSALLRCFTVKSNPTIDQVIEDVIFSISCSMTQLNNAIDTELFFLCLELSWSEIALRDDALLLNEPIASVIEIRSASRLHQL